MKKINYRFSPNVSGKKIGCIKLIDRLLFFLMPKTNFKSGVIKEITITQLAHIGDLILLLPALKKLRLLTNYKINLVVSSQNYSIASKVKFVDTVTVVDAPYFARSKGSSYLKFIKQLRQIKTDLIFDVRGDLRNNFFLKTFTRHKVLAGYNVGGGEALLDVVMPYGFSNHITSLLDPLFDYLQIAEIDIAACWHEKDLPYETIEDHNFPPEFLVVHLGAGAQARKWHIENFLKTIKAACTEIPVYVLGTQQDIAENELELLKGIPNVTVCVGKYNIMQSIYIVRKCTMFLGLDSGFTHIAAMAKKKVFVLFSGAANKEVWKPYSFYKNQVSLINHKVECDMGAGCGKLVCQDNICMKSIYPYEVITLIGQYLKKPEKVY